MVKTIDNYDITDIKSGDDTDDEERTKKPIANWAKGNVNKLFHIFINLK